MRRREPAHLLMGTFEPDAGPADGRRHQLALLKRLARALCRRGMYAVTFLRGTDGEDLAMVAVEHRADTLRVSRTLQARTAAPFGPWLSHRCFFFDAATRRRVASALFDRRVR
jgi:hypothetical protein